MRWPTLLLSFWFAAAFATQSTAAEGRIIKVLPHFLDRQGRHALSPSLYDRDAYQAQLRQQPEQRSGMEFKILWKAKGPSAGQLLLRVELRGIAANRALRQLTLEKPVEAGKSSKWTGVGLKGEEYKGFGEVTAWKVSLLEDGKELSSQQSFLW